MGDDRPRSLTYPKHKSITAGDRLSVISC